MPDDALRQQILTLHGCEALVLAGPGCGKTHLLAERIFHAHEARAVPFARMLCVTFTNRAAREMLTRIKARTGITPHDLFVGNIHRFCLRFLSENSLLPPDTAILDEDDRSEVLATFGLRSRVQTDDFLRKAAYIYQDENGHPQHLRRAPHTPVTATDVARYQAYSEYKRDHKLIDFDDILLITYTALMNRHRQPFALTGYTWVQIDEVQDMTPLQLAIIEAVSTPAGRTSLFLGDEQQAIFNFTGAGGTALVHLKELCGEKILHLTRNFRSSPALVALCNALATAWLGIDPGLLPAAVARESATDPLVAWQASAGNLRILTAAMARRWRAANPDEKLMVLTRTNAEADELSAIFGMLGLSHFHIPKQDLFHQSPFKIIWSHLAAIIQGNAGAWVRLIHTLRGAKTLTDSRSIVARLRDAALAPDDLLSEPGNECITAFAESFYDSFRTIVVLDTETTGLDVFGDDVVQLAALRIKGGKIVEGSELNLFIESEKPLPPTLADGTPNPLLALYDHAEKLSPEDAFARLADYIGVDSILAGHNIAFDLAILRNNIQRRTSFPLPQPLSTDATHIDSLRISRLLFPRLRSHRLGSLLGTLCIAGANSHMADDDTAATAALLMALAPVARLKLYEIKALRADESIKELSSLLAEKYGEFYTREKQRLEEPGGSLSDAICRAHNFFTSQGLMPPISHLNYICALVDSFMARKATPPHLRNMLSQHLYDLLTYHESDLFASGIVDEKISVMTVHKAKGLEADNVIVHDVTARYGTDDDHTRLLYVAFSRARKRLAIGMSRDPDGVILSFLRHFRLLSRREIAVAVNAESMNFESNFEAYLQGSL